MDQHAAKELQERQKQVMEAQQKLEQLSRQRGQLESRLKAFAMEGRRAQLTQSELETLKEQPTYKSVGRMFVLRPRQSLIEELEKRQRGCLEEIEKMEEQKKGIERQIPDAEQEFKKLLMQFQEEMKLAQAVTS
eukprot:TRINITY_DN15617_c0_g1_i1.p2 TRINITY_DN15617_c0_g1~~TRINITY_DN15617_c0_g1_i1.p2  ORF type:complete len:134 (+),score=70.57 TRINITY_DN15617_c0_g1_i1:92-493(+)